MANLFKTGQELKQERMADLSASNIKIARAGGRDNREKANRGLGAALGTALVGAFEEDKIGAGDVIKQFDIETPEGAAQAAAQLAKMGMVEASDNMLARVKSMQSIMKEGGGGAGKKVDPITNNTTAQLTAGSDMIQTANPAMGEIVASITAEGADVYEKVNYRSLVSSMVTIGKEISRDARTNLKYPISEVEVQQRLAKHLTMDSDEDDDTQGAFKNDAWFWGTEGTVDVKSGLDRLKQAKKAVLKEIRDAQNPKSQPVEVVEATPSTKMDDNVYAEDGTVGIPTEKFAQSSNTNMPVIETQGNIIKGAGKGSIKGELLANPPPDNFETASTIFKDKIKVVNEKIKASKGKAEKAFHQEEQRELIRWLLEEKKRFGITSK